MNIKNIEIYSETGKFDTSIQRAKVYYEDGNIDDITDVDDIVAVISKFAVNNRLGIDELIADEDKMKIIPIITLPPKEEEKGEDKPAAKDEPIEKDEKSKDSKDKKRRIRAWILSIVAFLSLTGAGYYFFKKYNKNDFVNTRRSAPGRTITREVHYPQVEDNGSQYLSTLNNYVQKEDVYYNIQDYLNGKNKSESNLSNILNDISNKCQANVNEMCQFVDGGRMSGDIYTLNLQNMYDTDNINYAILEKFCGLRNKVMENAFNNNREGTISALRNFYNSFIDFVYCDVPLNINGQDIRYYQENINGFTRHALLTMAQVLMEANVNDYDAMIGNSTYNISDLRKFVNSTHNNLVDILYESVSKTR